MKELVLRVHEKYVLQRRIGEGSFGAVYLASDVDNDDEEVAIKLEDGSVDPSLLQGEVEVYESLAGGTGIPRVYWSGYECEYRVMVFELLGPSLEDLFNYCGRRFSLKTVLMIADQLICRLQLVHSKDVIHRDIKAEIFLMGTGRTGNCIYITDLGLAAEYVPHRPYMGPPPSNPHLLGTAEFASINGHLGIRTEGRDRRSEVRTCHGAEKAISAQELCNGQPREIAAYMNHVRSLKFQDRPKYSYLRRIFRNLFVRRGFEYDNVFDWTVKQFVEQQEM
ncbi:MAG: serine/threonine protein kinase [Sclerophora amabilis]|nr:MAG: serine/threonine protein kinase [Sclerophora amabilis]